MGSGFVVFIPYMIKKTLNAFGWVPTAIQGLFMVAYLLCGSYADLVEPERAR